MGLLDTIVGFFSTSTRTPPKPPFLIEVARAESSAGLKLKDLQITHPGCGGGKFVPVSDDSWLDCERCHATIHLYQDEHSIGVIFRTAFDGEARWVRSHHVPEEFSGVRVQVPNS